MDDAVFDPMAHHRRWLVFDSIVVATLTLSNWKSPARAGAIRPLLNGMPGRWYAGADSWD